MLKEGILSCEALNGFYGPQFEQNRDDKDYLERVITLYQASTCKRSDIYLAAYDRT